MTRVTLHRDVLARLPRLDRPAELCDEGGVVVGLFVPAVPSSAYRGLDSPASEEELLQSEREPARTLSEILRGLEGRT